MDYKLTEGKNKALVPIHMIGDTSPFGVAPVILTRLPWRGDEEFIRSLTKSTSYRTCTS